MKRLITVMAVLAPLVLGVPPGAAQPPDELRALRQEIEALKAEQAKVLSELQAIKELLRGRGAASPAPPPSTPVVLDVGSDPVRGEQRARVVLVEFSDYQCPFCGRYFRDTLPQIEKEYIQTGKMRYVAREFPLEGIHPQAFKAAEAALCAGDQGKYWDLHDRLFGNQKALAPADLVGHARALGLDQTAFQQCLDSGRKVAKIRKDLAEGQRMGVGGTPTFYIGAAEDAGSTIKVLGMIRGAQPFGNFKEAIERALAAQH